MRQVVDRANAPLLDRKKAKYIAKLHPPTLTIRNWLTQFDVPGETTSEDWRLETDAICIPPENAVFNAKQPPQCRIITAGQGRLVPGRPLITGRLVPSDGVFTGPSMFMLNPKDYGNKLQVLPPCQAC
jgi:hypothetical protein